MEIKYSKATTVLNQSGAELAYITIPYDKLSRLQPNKSQHTG